MIEVIYIPGLGDKKHWLVNLQGHILRSWHRYGVTTEIFTMSWTNNSSITIRLEELSKKIDTSIANGKNVVLVGVSAGASVAVSMFARRSEDVHAAISICGQLEGADKVINEALDINPRFKESLMIMDKELTQLSSADRKRILALHAVLDAIVPPEHSILKGAHNKKMKVLGHLPGIWWALVVWPKRIIQFCRSTN